MKKLTALLIALGFAGVSHAATVTGTVEVDISENASNDYISTESIKLGIAGDSGVAFGSIKVKTNASDQFVLDEYSIGANLTDTASVSLSYTPSDIITLLESGLRYANACPLRCSSQ